MRKQKVDGSLAVAGNLRARIKPIELDATY
jgi:hypothetical protein